MRIKLPFIYFPIILFLVFHNAQAQTEEEIVSAMYSGSADVVNLSNELITISVNAVWIATGIVGNITTTGTLTQSTSNPDNWTYVTSPSDKLLLVYSNGATMSFNFIVIDGYTEGTADDFIESHNMDFISEIPNKLNIEIISITGPSNGKTVWQRTIAGTSIFDGIAYTVELNYSGNKYGEIGSGMAFYYYYEETSGTASSSEVNFVVDESYSSSLAVNSNTGINTQDRTILNNNSAQSSTTSYGFSDAYCTWHSWTSLSDAEYVLVNEPYYWGASGYLLKNNQIYGNVQFDRPVVEGTYGPLLIARCNNGSDYLLNSLLNPIVSEVKDIINLPSKFELLQNYPNPFNPTTVIKYSIPASETGHTLSVQLRIYDVLGREITMLVNKKQNPGLYKVNFDASQLPSGVYIYRISVTGGTENYYQTKKMILLK